MDADERGFQWPVDWSAVWVGALAAVSVALVFGLAGIALGAHKIGVRVTSWSDFSFGALILACWAPFWRSWSVAGAPA